MKKFVVLCTLLIQSMPVLQCSSRALQKQGKPESTANRVQRNKKWHAGTYRGLTAGKSKGTDVLRILGEPKRQDRLVDQSLGESNPEVWYLYDTAGEFAGELTVVIEKRTDVVSRIDLNPDNLSKADVVKHFGPDYILTRYDFDDCLGNEESAPLYESPNGPLLEIEYRQSGIAVSVDEAGRVKTISYVSKPIGAQESKCNRLKKQEQPVEIKQ
jgi:hypothetical protein